MNDTTTDPRPTWTYHDPNLRKASTIRVEPSFMDHLGSVFVGIGDWDHTNGGWVGDPAGGVHRGIWLNQAALGELRAALDAAEAWSNRNREDDEN